MDFIIDSPVFIVGYQRSGTSLIREEVSAHPDFCIPPESSFLTWLYKDFSDWKEKDCDSGRVEQFINAVIRARKFDLWQLAEGSLHQQIEAKSPTNYADLVAQVYRAYCVRAGKPSAQWGDKNNVHGFHLEQVFALYENARVIWVLRDPRDVWASLRQVSRSKVPTWAAEIAPSVPATVEDFCEQWVLYQEAVHQVMERNRKRFLRVEYENFVRNARIERQRVFRFLGKEFQPSDLRRRGTGDLGPEALLSWKDGVTDSPHTKSIGRYRAELTFNEQSLIEQAGRITVSG